MIKSMLYTATVLALVISCESAKHSDPLDKAQTVNDITKMLSDYHTDTNKEGLTAEFKYLDRSSDFFWVPPGYTSTLKYDSIRNILEKNAKAFRAVEFRWKTLEIFPLSEEIATYSGIVNGRMTDTAGIESKVSIIESGTLIKRGDGWKLLSGQSAVINPPSENKSSE